MKIVIKTETPNQNDKNIQLLSVEEVAIREAATFIIEDEKGIISFNSKQLSEVLFS
jgi:hypothetical protein